jgi:hypothetical protein
MATIEGGEQWFAIRDIAVLIGQKNPRHIMTAHCKNAVEKEFSSKSKRGCKVILKHIGLADVISIVNKAYHGDKAELLTWLDTITKTRSGNASGKPFAPMSPKKSAVDILSDEEVYSDKSKAASKRKARLRVLAIGITDYSALTGISKTTVYNRITNRTLKTVTVRKNRYIWVTERDEEYEQIEKYLDSDSNNIGIVEEWRCAILG